MAWISLPKLDLWVRTTQPVSHTTQANAFIARTSGLDSTHKNAYYALIDGLVNDGVWTAFDALYILATQDETTAKLNLISASFPLSTIAPGLTFVADRGSTSINPNGCYDTGFNPSTAGGNYSLNSAHISVWDDGIANTSVAFGALDATNDCCIFGAPFTAVNDIFRINSSSNIDFGAATGSGLFLASRTTSNNIDGYKNSTLLGSINVASVGLINLTLRVVGANGGASTTCQVQAASFGAKLTSTQEGNFYNRMRTYMTTVGVP